MFTIFKVHRNSQRPDRVIDTTNSYEEACERIDELTSGNDILAQEYAIKEGDEEQNTYVDERGFWQFK